MMAFREKRLEGRQRIGRSRLAKKRMQARQFGIEMSLSILFLSPTDKGASFSLPRSLPQTTKKQDLRGDPPEAFVFTVVSGGRTRDRTLDLSRVKVRA